MKLESDAFSIFKIDKNIKLTDKYTIQRSFHGLELSFDKYVIDYMHESATFEIKKKFIDLFEDIREEYIDVIGLDTNDSLFKLSSFLSFYECDFILCSDNLRLLMNMFNYYPDPYRSVGSLFNFGKLGNVDFFYAPLEDDTIICGKRNSLSYNYHFDDVSFKNEHSLIKDAELKYYMNFHINKEEFIKLHYVSEYKPKFKDYFRDKTIGNILNI
jgi:hypothetical protein